MTLVYLFISSCDSPVTTNCYLQLCISCCDYPVTVYSLLLAIDNINSNVCIVNCNHAAAVCCMVINLIVTVTFAAVICGVLPALMTWL